MAVAVAAAGAIEPAVVVTVIGAVEVDVIDVVAVDAAGINAAAAAASWNTGLYSNKQELCAS